ncbi:EamA family transporter [Pelagibacterium xiamenense]|uniref:EamA family transporter n=1 Tax=Pelagibacterium xiamenense TaxID=2901140 RepID=UPI001E45D63F|nr:EamA family transporter [Pelagibacterium xiamenense]MCD7058286.1 EamA family transporter [Pelagibacterium xiamenense]
MPPRDILMALVVVTIWGVNFTVIKLSVAEIPPILVAALRFFFAAVPMIFFVSRPRARWRLVVGYGLFMGTALYSLLNIALYLGMPASLASLVLQVQAMFTIGLAFFFLGETPRRLQIAGAAVAFAGIGVIAAGHGVGAEALPLAILLLAAFAWACANTISKKAGAIPMIPFTVWGNFFASIPLLGLSLVFEGAPAMIDALAAPSWTSVGLVAFLAYPATLFGFAMWSGLLSRHSAATVAPFTLLVPVTGIASGVLILGEPIHAADVAGGALIMTGLVLTVFRIKTRQATAPAA